MSGVDARAAGATLVIDCGNTRVKWGVHEEGAWIRQGAVPVSDVSALASEWKSLQPPRAMAIANVAGPALRDALDGLLARFTVEPRWVTPTRSECGVVNEYLEPAQLGPDRWAALVGARHLQSGACVVVNAGTATTVDMLTEQGVFRGGVILPGLSMMKRSLAAGTASLPEARGQYSETPQTTQDAIETGCLLAQVGAIEHFTQMAQTKMGSEPICLVSGGEAARIAPLLRVRTRLVNNLVLEGLLRLAHP